MSCKEAAAMCCCQGSMPWHWVLAVFPVEVKTLNLALGGFASPHPVVANWQSQDPFGQHAIYQAGQHHAGVSDLCNLCCAAGAVCFWHTPQN